MLKDAGNVLSYLISISGSTTFIARTFIGLAHVEFRAAMKAQGILKNTRPNWSDHGLIER